jgi:hypothetical protein
MTSPSKFIEIRDAGTFIPALAIPISREDGYLARRAGFGDRCIYLIKLNMEMCAYDPYSWTGGARTMTVAHEWIREHWDEITDGQVVDVEYILGLRATPKESEEVTT